MVAAKVCSSLIIKPGIGVILLEPDEFNKVLILCRVEARLPFEYKIRIERILLAVIRNGLRIRRQCAHIIINGIGGIAGQSRCMEYRILCRHDINHCDTAGCEYCAVLRIPCVIVRCPVIGLDRELIHNALLVFGLDLFDRGPAVSAPHLERQGVLRAVIVDVDNGVALRADRDVLIEFLEVEAGQPLVRAVDPCIGVIACANLHNGVDLIADCSIVNTNRLHKVIAVFRQILLPDDDRVAGSRILRPLGINNGALVDFFTKSKLVTVGAGRIRIPAAKGIAVAHHLGVRPRALRDIAGLDELRSVIGRAPAVFVKHKPVAGRRIDGEGHVASDGNLRTILVRLAGKVLDMTAACLVGSIPALKVVVCIAGRIGLVDRISLFRLGVVRTEGDLLAAERNPVLIQIVNLIGLDEDGVVIDFIAILELAVELGGNIRADAVDGHRLRAGCVAVVSRPALEGHALFDRQLTARIVEHGVRNRSVLDVGLLYVHRGNDALVSLSGSEVDLQSRGRVGRIADDVDREVPGADGNRLALARGLQAFKCQLGRSLGGVCLGRLADAGFHLRQILEVPDSGVRAESLIAKGERNLLSACRLAFLTILQDGDIQRNGIGQLRAQLLLDGSNVLCRLAAAQLSDVERCSLGESPGRRGNLDGRPVRRSGPKSPVCVAHGEHIGGKQTQQHDK